MRIRGYQRGDVEVMYRLDLACFELPFQFDREMMQQAAETQSAVVVIMEDEAGVMLGFVIVHAEGAGHEAYGYVVTIDVTPAARMAGVGATMLQEAEQQARHRGLKRMGLHVAVTNAGAITFYERRGYQRTGIAKRFYQEAKLDALVYVKQL